jgi:hypothetical protein
MTNITLYVPENVKKEMDTHSDISWSDVVRQAILSKINELRKLTLLRKYVEKEPFSDDDLRWMDDNDWHPVDERQMSLSFVKDVQNQSKGRFIKARSVSEIFE